MQKLSIYKNLVLFAFLGVLVIVFLWQIGLFLFLKYRPIPCGGDWNYWARCPFGGYCQKGNIPLVGGSCKPIFLKFFRSFDKGSAGKTDNVGSERLVKKRSNYYNGSKKQLNQGNEIQFEILSTGEVHSSTFSSPNVILIDSLNSPSLKTLGDNLNEKDLQIIKSVDFAKYSVLVIFAGEVPTAGWKIKVEKIEKEGEIGKVYIKKHRPSGMAAAVISYPYVIVKDS
ncbi:MAG: hypothetical protein KatS3mg090_0409 [Patescibacteria group bacterium]|nr:MAG: hypothetical protein KatS3mg090_0409 [Patescibacteria group bacterium]